MFYLKLLVIMIPAQSLILLFILNCVHCTYIFFLYIQEDPLAKPVPLPVETLTTLILCLQRCMSNVSPECQEAIVSIINSCSMVLKSRQQSNNTLMRGRSIDAGLNPSLFAGQLYGHAGVEQLQNLSTNLSNMTLAG